MELEREFQRPNKRFCQLKVRKIKWKMKTAERKKIPSSCRFKSYFCNLLFHFGKKQFLITLRSSEVFFFFPFPLFKSAHGKEIDKYLFDHGSLPVFVDKKKDFFRVEVWILTDILFCPTYASTTSSSISTAPSIFEQQLSHSNV